MSRAGFESASKGARRTTGMTLVEIMVSLVVLAFGLLGVAALQVRAITESSGGQHLSTASALARNRVEELSRLDWSADTVLPMADETFNRAERITDNEATAADTTVKAIEVRITWTDTKRQNRSVVLSSARLREVDE
jgi:type IV pilus assembly protein PilV